MSLPSGSSFSRTVLPNGVRLLLDPVPHVRSASVGVWIDVGSRNETEAEGGLSHFIEHMLFKGTATLDAQRLNHRMNLLGGNFNAFTSQENICLTAKVIDEHLDGALALLSDMLLASAFPPDELDRERNVILEEIRMYDDTPDELVVDVFTERLFDGHALGRPIIGTPENVTRFSADDVRTYMDREFTPDRMLVAVAGKFDAGALLASVEKWFGGLPPAPLRAVPGPDPVPAFRSRNLDRKLSQVHFCMGTDGPPRSSEDRYAFGVMNTILGAGASSRIFQEVREKRGLAYSVGSTDWSYRDSGCFAVTGGSSPKTVAKVVDLCLAEVKRICAEPVTSDELESAREQIKSGVLLAVESTSARMHRMAESELYHGRQIPVEETVARSVAVSPDDILRVAGAYLQDRPVAFASIGPEKRFEPYLQGLKF